MNDHPTVRELPLGPFIHGEALASEGDEAVAVVNPSTAETLYAMPVGNEHDVDRAVASARRAFEDGAWSATPPSTRKQALSRLADLVEAEAKALDALDAAEMGKPIGLAFGGAAKAASLIRFNAEAADKILGDTYSSDKFSFVAQRRVPRGVVAAVVPWNFPTYVAALKAAPALAAGNCVVLKPSELSPSSAIRMAQLAVEAGLPPGVFNVVPGVGRTVGQALGLHMDVDMITFTGSTNVGKLMMQYAGRSNLKSVMAECGGKSPQIVFDDGVDLEAACGAIARTLLTNQGQLCVVGSRVLVQRSIESRVVERLIGHLEGIVVGDAREVRTTFGPVASADQCSRVMGFIDGAASEGANLATGGQRALPQSNGYFVQPTLFRNVRPEARIAQEEIFGPVLSVIPFEDEAEALRIANGTIYGLKAYVWTADLSRGMRMAKGLNCSVSVNAAAPMGEGAGLAGSSEPMSQSGVGTEGGIGGLESYFRRQQIIFSHA